MHCLMPEIRGAQVGANERNTEKTRGSFSSGRMTSGETRRKGSNRVSPRLTTRVTSPERHMAVADCTARFHFQPLGIPRERGFAFVVMTRSDPAVTTPA